MNLPIGRHAYAVEPDGTDSGGCIVCREPRYTLVHRHDNPVPFWSSDGERPTLDSVAGWCGHRMGASAWRAGLRVCKRCPEPAECCQAPGCGRLGTREQINEHIVAARHFSEDPPAGRRRQHCRHCGREIRQLAGGWADRNGLMRCMKAEPEAIGRIESAAVPAHEPLPDPVATP